MEKDLEKTSRNRSISGGESNNNEELVSMDVEEESEASTASSLNQQQQQQQQRKLWRSKSTVRSQESSLEAATAVTNDELKELKQWFQWEKSLSIDAAIHQERLVWQRQQRGTRCGTVAENERLKERVQVLGHENYELTRMLKNEQIRNRDEDASQRRCLRQAAAKARLETRAARRLQVMEAAAVQQAQLQIKQLEETIDEKDKSIAKLEAEKYYLGERVFELTGVEEGFWSDEVLTKPVISERERGLLQRANSLNIHISQLQRNQRILSSENEQLKRQMEMERERPAGQLQRERERQQELQLLRRKNAELAMQTKKLEEKVRSLEKKSKELPAINGERTQQVVTMSRERSIDNKLQPQVHHQQQQQQQQAKQTTNALRWREKEVEMQNRLTEREKEIGRLKEKLRDLTKKLQQEQQHYNSKESLQTQQNGVEWTILSQGSRELEGLLKLVSKERLQLERNFVLATQGLQRSAELDVTRYSALEATNVQLRRQVEQLELLCKEQAEAAQQLSKRQQDREVLAERLKAKTEYSQDLENQLSKVIDKNAELTIENCDLKKQAQELHQFETECQTLRSSLNTVESQCQAAQSEVAQLKEKMAGLDHVLRQMREAAEKKKELEKQHGESVNELRTAQAQLGLLASNKNTEVERAQHSQNIESLQSRIRELERKMELQNVRHDELLLELAALRRNQHHHHSNSSGAGSSHHGSSQSLGATFDLDSRGSSPDSLRYLANGAGSVTRTTPLGQSASNLDALLEMDLAVSNYNLGKSLSQPVVSTSSMSKLTGINSGGSSSSSSHHHSDIERIMAKIEQDNRVLAELEKSRATITVSQEKGKTVTFASDDMVLHYGGQNRHRRKSTPASLNRTPLLHHHHQQQHQMIQQQPQYHQPSATALLLQQQQHHHLRFSPPVSAHLRHWLAPGIETSKKSSGYSSHNGASGSAGQSMSPSLYGSTSSSVGLTSTLTNTSSMFFPASGSGSNTTAVSTAAADLAHTLSLGVAQQQQHHNSSLVSGGLRSTLTAPGSGGGGSMASMLHPPLSPLSLPALPLDAHSAHSLLHTVPLHSFRHPEPESSADMLEIPGKGRCYVYLAKYTYDPFSQSPNDNPEAEVSLAAGDYVLVWGTMDEDGFYEGELLDGRKGLVPSNFIQRLQGEDLVEFHRAAVLGLQICGDDSSTTSLPRDLLGVSPNHLASVGGGGVGNSSRAGHPSHPSIHQLPSHPQHQQQHQQLQQQQHQLQQQQQQQQGLPHQQPIAANEPIDQAHMPAAGSSQVAFHSPASRSRGINQYDAARQALDWGLMELQEFLEDEELALGVKGEGPDWLFLSLLVPPPRQLTLERQLNKSILIGWNHPEGAPPESGQIASYHVYVDGILRTTIRAGDRCRALIEGVDSSKPHRISVRSVTLRRRASLDAACTMVIGKEVPSAPTCVRVSHVTATSALISWLPANSNYQHVVCVNHVEVRTVKPGIFRHTISGLSPNTIYRVTVKAKNIRSPHFNTMDETTAKYAEKYCTHVEFRTLPKGVPDPPVDVQVELGPQDGTLLVTWLPVTINSQSGKSNGVPVTGYAVYADGRKVTEVDSPTGDHALLDISSFMGLQAKHVTVRTKARESQSGDSVPTPVPIDLIKNRGGNRNDDVQCPVNNNEMVVDETDVVEHSFGPSEDIVGLWNLSLLASIKDTLESDERPSELSDIAEEPEEYQDCSSDGEMMNETSRGSNNIGRRNFMEQSNNGRGQQGGGGMIQRNQYLNPSMPGPIPSIEITKDTASERSGDSYRGRDGQQGMYDRNKSLPANRNPQMVGGPRNVQGQQQQQQGRDNYYASTTGRNQQQQQNDGYYDQPGNRRGPVARGGNGRQPPMQQQTRIFVALFDYDPPTMSPNPDACDEELPFREGQLIKVRGDKDADGFYWGEVAGRSGYVPCNMVSEVQVDDERVAQELLKESGADGPSHSRTRRNLRAQGQPGHGRDRWGDIYANMPVKRMIALYDYDPQELSPNVDAEVELSFQTGDIIYVYGDMDDDGFYLGELRGQRGLVPSNFLTEAPPDYDPSQPRHKRGGQQQQQQSANMNDKSGGGGQMMQDRGRDSSYYGGNRSRERMDHDRMDPRDGRGMSGAEGPPPPPRTTNHRPSDNSRDRRSDVYSPDRHEGRSMAAVGRDGNNPINNQRFYAEDSFSDVDDRFKGRPDSMDYAYNNGMADPMQQQLQGMNGQPQQQQQQQPNFNGGTGGPIRNLPMNKTTRGLPPVLPDPSVIQQQQQQHLGQPPLNNMMMMNADANNHLYGHANNVAAPQQATTAPTSAPLSSHFSFFGMGGNNQQQQQQQQQQSTGPSLIQKMMGGVGGAATAAAAPTTTTSGTTENPVEGLLSKGKDLIFKKFGL
ncbi:uncharacterized protein LOC124203590 isoform X6 [Daphnia pulex]|uniref:uncharacterized protein LOC124203590 isoform X6 n=1 Tax=Daphnia pulex TaxID=6669 RepID=UPI001EE0C7A8|nr:uncharacterized protein LOC124203590 isoform X6 [Daphnia pulex]XP_046456235.1 uncharacterized protein LOC124203590 isoform X6 [Daphnia pulex]